MHIAVPCHRESNTAHEKQRRSVRNRLQVREKYFQALNKVLVFHRGHKTLICGSYPTARTAVMLVDKTIAALFLSLLVVNPEFAQNGGHRGLANHRAPEAVTRNAHA